MCGRVGLDRIEPDDLSGAPHQIVVPGMVRRGESIAILDGGDDDDAPGWASLSGRDGDGDWTELLARTRVQPDTVHRFWLEHATPATHVRLDVYPDGGLARLRLPGTVTTA